MVCTQTERGLESKFHRAQPTELAMYLYVPLSSTKVQFSFRPSFWDGSNRRLTEMSDCRKIVSRQQYISRKTGPWPIVDLKSIWNPSWKHEWPFRMCSNRRLMATIVNHWLLLLTTYGHAIVDLLSRLRTTDPSYRRLMDMLSSTYWRAIDDLRPSVVSHQCLHI